MSGDSEDLQRMLGSPKKALISMAVPLFFSILVVTLQSFIDGIWCSGLGPDPLSAITISIPVHGIIVSVGVSLGVGASAAIARALGAGDKAKADSLASQSVVLTVIVSILSIPVMFLAAEPIIAISGGGYNIDLSMSYVLPYILCTLPLMSNGLLLGLIRSEGAAKKSSVLAIAAAVINMVLDPIFIYVMDLGVSGAAWATCISFMITGLVAVSWYWGGRMHVTPRFHGFRFRADLLKEIGVVTVPMLLEFVVMNLLIAPEQMFVASCGGSDGLVVYMNTFRFVSLALIPANALGSALLPVISAQIGQKSPEKVWTTFWYALRCVFLIEAVLGILLFIFSDYLIDLYMNSPDMWALHDEMVTALRIYCVVPVFNGIMHIGGSILKALRRAMLSTVTMFIRELMFLSFYWIASQVSMEAIFWSLDLTNLLAMIMVLTISLITIRIYMRKSVQYSIVR